MVYHFTNSKYFNYNPKYVQHLNSIKDYNLRNCISLFHIAFSRLRQSMCGNYRLKNQKLNPSCITLKDFTKIMKFLMFLCLFRLLKWKANKHLIQNINNNFKLFIILVNKDPQYEIILSSNISKIYFIFSLRHETEHLFNSKHLTIFKVLKTIRSTFNLFEG